MRVLLCFPAAVRSGGTATIPKLGLGFLGSALRAASHEVEVLDCEQQGVTPEIAKATLSQRWDAVGFQVFNNGLQSFRRLLGWTRSANPACATVAGGPLASGMGDWLLERHRDLDFVLRGEAEESLVALLDRRAKGTSAADIPGIILREGDTVVVGAPPVSPRLDEVLPPAWDLIPPAAYPPAPVGAFAAGYPVGPVITSRGCPFACPYCATRVIHGPGFRVHPPAAVLDSMRELVCEYGVKEIQILDDCFGANRSQAESLLHSYIVSPWRVPLSFPNGTRLDLMDAPFLRLLERAGTRALTFGVDFGTDRMLQKTGRRMTVDDIRERIHLVRETTNMRVAGNFILGHFDDTLEGMRETVRFACELPLDRAHFSAYLLIPGTADWERISQEFDVGDLDIESMDFTSFSLSHPSATRQELRRLKRTAIARFYLNPRRMVGIVHDINSVSNLMHLVRKLVYHVR